MSMQAFETRRGPHRDPPPHPPLMRLVEHPTALALGENNVWSVKNRRPLRGCKVMHASQYPPPPPPPGTPSLSILSPLVVFQTGNAGSSFTRCSQAPGPSISDCSRCPIHRGLVVDCLKERSSRLLRSVLKIKTWTSGY